MTLLAEVATRKRLWEIVPWDPISWLLVHAEHQEYLNGDNMEVLIGNLVATAEASRAAYGYAITAGHLDTVENFIAMHTLHSHYFNPVTGASASSNVDAVLDITGYKREDIVMSDWKNDEYKPCHFLAVDQKRKCIVLAIRGSMELGDLFTDLSGSPLSVEFGGVQGNVHEGSMAAAIYVQFNTAPHLADVYQKYPGWPLFITGHSIGGGVAAILGMLFKFENMLPPGAGEVTCITFGTAAVMSENLAELCKEFVTSVVFRYDVVPRLSAYSIECLLSELSNASPAKRTVDKLIQTASSAINTIKKGISDFAKPKSQPEKQEPPVPELRIVQTLVQDDEAAQRAVRAIEPYTQSDEKHNPVPSVRSPVRSPDQQTVQDSKSTFTPLFPAGRVLWLIGPHLIKTVENQKPDTRPLPESTRDASRPISDQAPSVSTVIDIDEKVAKDMKWLEEWMDQSSSSSDQIPPDLSDQTDSSRLNQEKTDGIDEPSSSLHADGMLIEADRKSFGRLLIHPFMLQDHLPGSYSESLLKLEDKFHRKTKN